MSTAIGIWRTSPLATKVGAIIAVAGYWLSLGGSTTRAINGEVACDGLDIGPFLVGGLVVAAALLGVQPVRQAQPSARPATRTFAIVTTVVLAAGAFHILRGLLNPAGDLCSGL
jgi:hypothetical protein